MTLGSALNFAQLEALNLVIQNLSSAPSSPVEGQLYGDTVSHQLGYYDGTDWVYFGTGAGTVTTVSVVSANGFAGSVANATTTPAITLSTTVTGILKGNGTAISAATAGTDYVTGSSSNTFTNKTFDANGTGNSISNIETADFASNVIDTDTSFTANSDTRLASQKAIKTYVDTKVVGLLDYQGAIDASANPNFPAASKGDVYRISVAGKIGGASGADVQAGDEIIANADNAGGTLASVGASWDIIQGNIAAASTTVAGYVELATLAEAEAKSSSTLAVTPASIANFPIKKTATIGDGSTTALVVTDNLGTKDKIAIVRDATTDEQIIVDTTYDTNTTTFTFAVAPATNAYKVVIIG